MVPIVSFFTSAVLLALLVLLRRAEIGRGSRYLPRFRERADRFAVRFSVFCLRTVPSGIIRGVRFVVIHGVDIVTSGILWAVQWFEGKLHRFVHSVKGKKDTHANGGNNGHENASHFLKHVANHKEEIRSERENGEQKEN